MKDKAKQKWLVVLGALVCVALVMAIAGRFGAPTPADPALNDDTPISSEPVVDISEPENTGKPNVAVDIDAGDKQADPGAGADSDGTEQTIQTPPTKPDAPEKPTPIKDDHGSEDVPEDERNTETPPSYTETPTVTTPPSEPQGGSTNADGQIYVPGFGYMESGGEGSITVNEDMYENGNKVGIMD